MDLTHIIHIKRGSVYKWYEYPFEDNDTAKDKYWITLNCEINGFPMNAILPTSQWNNHYYLREENMIDTIVFEANESQFFNKKTIIDLKNIVLEEEEQVKEGIKENFLKYLGELETNLFQRIEKAIEYAITISNFDKQEYLCQE